MSTPYDYITINTPSGGISTTYTGTQISVNTPAISDATKAEVALKAKQTLNGYSYPWAGGAGKNKLPLVIDSIKALNTTGTWANNSYTRNGVTFTVNVDSAGNINSITTSGTASADAALVFVNDYGGLPCVENESYIISDSVAGVASKIVFQARINNTWYEAYGNVESTFTYISSSTYKDYVRLLIKSGQNASGKTWKPMIRLASEADVTWQPYTNICPITGSDSVTLYKRSAQSSSYASSYYKYFNTTVYNGSFEYITGKVTKTYVSVTLNSTNQSWSVYNDSSTSRAFRATITNMKSLSHSSYYSTQCFCTQAKWTTGSERLSFGNFYYSYGYVYFPDYNSKRFNTVDEFTAWLDAQETAGTPVTILYPLSTPTETTVSTTTIKTLAGQNYFDTSLTAANRLPLTMTILQSSFMLPRPLNFGVQREDIYAGQYTTCTGATRADKIGWKYSDMTWSWDGLKQSDVEKLCSLSGECTLTFDDPSGDTIQESFIRSSVVSMRCRNKFEDEYWWTGVSCSISFIDSHTD